MRVIELKQRTPEWHAFRAHHITATDSGIICGVSPFSTPYELWNRKLGFEPEQEMNDHMRRGVDNEPKALEMFNARMLKHFEPMVVESSEEPIFAASLDGCYGDGSGYVEIVELKCGGSSSHAATHRGEIPLHYQYQLQHQMMITKANAAWFCNYHDEEIAVIRMQHDLEIQSEIYQKGKKFYECMMNFIPPDMTEKDFVDVRSDNYMEHLYIKYNGVKEKIDQLSEESDKLKEELIAGACNRSVKGNGWSMRKVISKGRIDTAKIEKDYPDIIMDEYRKEPIVSYRITTEKENV